MTGSDSLRACSAGPICSTVPISMPPEPVTGLWCLPRCATMERTAASILARSPSAWVLIWVKLAASMLSALTWIRISLSQISMWLSIFQAPCGSTPWGSSTRWMP